MRRYFSIWAVLLIAAAVHLDLHLGWGPHPPWMLGWPYHWILGLVAFFLLAWFCARKWPDHPVGAAILNAAAGLFAGQIIEPLLEVAIYRIPVADAFFSERWRLFWQFLGAAGVGLILGLAVWARRRPPAGS